MVCTWWLSSVCDYFSVRPDVISFLLVANLHKFITVGLITEMPFQQNHDLSPLWSAFSHSECKHWFELQGAFAKRASSAGKDPELEELQSQRRHLQSELTEQRHMVDILKKERIDLESEVRKLRLTKEQTERRNRYLSIVMYCSSCIFIKAFI